MKNNSSILTRSKWGLDNQVWLTLLIVCLASILIFSFKAATYVKCTDFEISVSGARQQNNHIFYIGETVNFLISIPSQSQQEWNFNDGTPTVQTLKKPVSHSFLKAGDYQVMCTVNGKCQQVITISIMPTPHLAPTDSVSFIGNPIIGVDTLYVGTIGHFTTPIKANYGYQWSVGTSPGIPIQTTATADFTFNKPGSQIVQLKIDGNRSYSKPVVVLSKTSPGPKTGDNPLPPPIIKLPPVITFIDPPSGGPGTLVTIHGSLFNGTKSVSFGGIPAKIISIGSDQIVAEIGKDGATGAVVVTTENNQAAFSNPPFTFIAPKQPEVAPAPTNDNGPKIMGITDKQLKQMLGQVISGSMHTADFDRYLCKGVNTKVYVNNAKTTVTFGELCEKQLQGKKVEIESAHISRDPDNPECITNITVKYKKKGLWPFN
jgi:hypothetical protein